MVKFQENIHFLVLAEIKLGKTFPEKIQISFLTLR